MDISQLLGVGGETYMTKIYTYKIHTEQMKPEKFLTIARRMEITNKLVQTDEALAIRDKQRILVYAQPGAKFAGLLMYTDQSKGMADPVKKPLDVERAKEWATKFLQDFDLIPRKVEDDRIRLSFDVSSYQTDAITYDGKERQTSTNKTEIGSKILLNDIRVVGPRAKVRIVFKNQVNPIFLYRGLWERIDVYEEKELIRAHDIVRVLKEKLADRRKFRANYEILSTKLAYFADEYSGGPDLLTPFYFIEIEHEDVDAKKSGITQGPRQVFWLPAYR